MENAADLLWIWLGAAGALLPLLVLALARRDAPADDRAALPAATWAAPPTRAAPPPPPMPSPAPAPVPLPFSLRVVAQELNNPLAVILASAAELELQASSPNERAHARHIHRAAERCARIVHAALSAHRSAPAPAHSPATGRAAHPVPTPASATARAVDLNRIASDSFELLHPLLGSHGIDGRLQLQAGLPPVAGDADALGQAVANLLVNAAQALHGWTGPRRVELCTQSCDGGRRVRLWVSDSGPGVPAGLARRIFEPFFTTRAEAGCTGIGLALARDIAQAHGGTLSVESAASPASRAGARFVLTLPALAPAHTTFSRQTSRPAALAS